MIDRLMNLAKSRVIPSRRLLVRVRNNSKALYLTFDDGPSPEVTPALLALLESHGVHASFFIQGEKAEQHPHLLRKIFSQGHTLGNHTFDHPRFNKINSRAKEIQVERTNQVIKNICNTRCLFFRAPHGRWDLRTLWYLVQSGMQAVHWSRDSLDYQQGNLQDIVDTFSKVPVAAGDIILFHDDAPLCIEALAELIPMWREHGFEFRKLSRW